MYPPKIQSLAGQGGAKQNAPAVSSDSICLDVSDIGNIELAKKLAIVSRSPHHTPAQSSSSWAGLSDWYPGPC